MRSSISERSLWIGPYLAETQGLSPVSIGNVALVMSLLMALGALRLRACCAADARAEDASLLRQRHRRHRLHHARPLAGPTASAPIASSRHHRIFRHELWLAHGARPSLHSGSPHRRRRDFHQLCFHAAVQGSCNSCRASSSTHAEAAGIDAPHRYAALHMALGPRCSRPRRFMQWRRPGRGIAKRDRSA